MAKAQRELPAPAPAAPAVAVTRAGFARPNSQLGDPLAQRRLCAGMRPVVLLVTAALYFRAVGAVPVYIGGDEARFAIAASSIASTGRDPAGDRLPLFFHLSDSLAANQGGTRWYQPLLFYLMALAFRFLPVTEQSMRLPTAVIGVLDVFLIYVVARRLFGGRRWATLAALLLALSPGELLRGHRRRQGQEVVPGEHPRRGVVAEADPRFAAAGRAPRAERRVKPRDGELRLHTHDDVSYLGIDVGRRRQRVLMDASV